MTAGRDVRPKDAPEAPRDRSRNGLELTPRGRITLLLVHLAGSAAYMTGEPVTQLATAALAAPFLVDLVVKLLARPRLRLSLSSRRTEAGRIFVETVRISNVTTNGHAHALTVEEPATAVWRDGGTVYVETLPAGDTAAIELPARARRRGLFDSRVIAVRSRHPFGMLSWRASFRVQARMVAEPARVELPESVLDEVRSAGDESDAVGVASGAEFFALREYRSGEDARNVHARRSAQLGTLVTRELRGGSNREAGVLVDLRRSPGQLTRGTLFGDHMVEHRISLAATLLDELRAHGVEPVCLVVGNGVRVFEPDQEIELMDTLAAAQPVPHESLDEAELRRRLPRSGKLYWIAAAGFDARRDARRVEARRGPRVVRVDGGLQ